MDNLDKRLTAFEERTDAMCARWNRRFRVVLTVYAILIVFVTFYTQAFLIVKIKELTAPKAMSEYAAAMMDTQVGAQRERLIAFLKDEQWPRFLVQKGVEYIPELEGTVKELIEGLTDWMGQAIETQVIPAFTRYIEQNAPELQNAYKKYQDKEATKAVVLVFIDTIEKEMDKYLNEHFVSSLEDLQKQLHELSRKDAQLSRKQDAERRFCMYWTFLVKNQQMGESVFKPFIDRLKTQVEAILGGFGLDGVLPGTSEKGDAEKAEGE